MPRGFLFVVLVVLSAATVFSGTDSSIAPRPHAAGSDTTFTYARVDTFDLKLDLYFPSDSLWARPNPVLLWIHGGGWRGGSRSDSVGPLGWRDSGFAVASVDYRLSQQARWPAQIHDVKAAVRWLRVNSETLGLDTGRIVAWGSSAGGHLASMLGVTGSPGDSLEGAVRVTRLGRAVADSAGVFREVDTVDASAASSRVNGVINFYGASDFLEPIPKRWTPWSSVGQLLGCGVAKCKERARGASPVYHVSPDDSPFLIVHGVHDTIVPVSQSLRLDSALRAAGVPVELVTVENGHGGERFAAPETLARVRAFLDTTLGRPAPAPAPPQPRGFWRRWF